MQVKCAGGLKAVVVGGLEAIRGGQEAMGIGGREEMRRLGEWDGLEIKDCGGKCGRQ